MLPNFEDELHRLHSWTDSVKALKDSKENRAASKARSNCKWQQIPTNVEHRRSFRRKEIEPTVPTNHALSHHLSRVLQHLQKQFHKSFRALSIQSITVSGNHNSPRHKCHRACVKTAVKVEYAWHTQLFRAVQINIAHQISHQTSTILSTKVKGKWIVLMYNHKYADTAAALALRFKQSQSTA